MRNRACCKLCGDILESFHAFDLVTCKCGEISITGGQTKYHCSAKDWANFLRLDDNNRVIPVKVDNEKTADPTPEQIKDNKPEKLSTAELIDMLHRFVQDIDALPTQARFAPVTHQDLSNFAWLILGLFKSLSQDNQTIKETSADAS